ncbi:MAG: monooxygenase [Nocardiopsaceae bacterium]|nr:monooxygenase [Nocardiopsaceae bacterium]
MAEGIGIIGAGVAGLHLGLYLQQHGVPSTIYGDKTARQLAEGRMLNTVAHHNTTVRREQALGVDHWDLQEYGYFCHHHYIGSPGPGVPPLRFPGEFGAPSRGIDYRVYLPRLLDDYTGRGGDFRVGNVGPGDLATVAADHELIVVATGKSGQPGKPGKQGQSGQSGLAGMFPPRPDKMPYERPMRRLCGGLYHGIAYSEPKGVTMSIAPGHGELLEIPMFSADGFVTALLFENIPGGDTEVLADARYDEDPKAFDDLVLTTLRTCHPTVFERADPATFGLTGPRDLVQGAITPTVREDWIRIDGNGSEDGARYAIAIGDAHTLVDPVIGQGANAASYEAWELGTQITEDPVFDERFCRKAAARRANRVEATVDWTNLMIGLPPAPHLLELLGAMSASRPVADEFTDNFNYPERQWDILATPERTRRFLSRHTSAAMERDKDVI